MLSSAVRCICITLNITKLSICIVIDNLVIFKVIQIPIGIYIPIVIVIMMLMECRKSSRMGCKDSLHPIQELR